MARSILGKRTRSTLYAATSYPSHIDARARHGEPHDNEIPDPALASSDAIADEHENLDIDELSKPVQRHPRCSKRRCIPLSSATRPQRVALASRDDNGQSLRSDISDHVPDVVQLPTPKTPRHRDALSKRIPVTPRHRIGLAEKLLTPRSSHTPSEPDSLRSIYKIAQRLFNTCVDPGRLVGRQAERDELENFIRTSIESREGRCLYVSGPPGTGKSALVGEICRKLQEGNNTKIAYVNCMNVTSSGEVYRKLAEQLLCEDQMALDNGKARLCSTLLPRRETDGPMHVVILDEIDHLLSTDVEALYTLFEWSLRRASRLSVVGIANALDLTDRFLPRLKAKNIKPQLLPFLPYTAQQIAEIITTKLRSLLPKHDLDHNGFVPILQPAAIQLCSKRVASQSGDLRKAFDIVVRTIDMIDLETRDRYVSEVDAASSSPSPSMVPQANPQDMSPSGHNKTSKSFLTAFAPGTAPRASLAHVSRVAAASFAYGTSQRLLSLNLQQKAVLCALISHQYATRRTANLEDESAPRNSVTLPTIRQSYETYYGLCKQSQTLQPLTSTEFFDVIGGLETMGLVGEKSVGRGHGTRLRAAQRRTKGLDGITGWNKKVFTFVEQKELVACLGSVDGSILRGFLQSNT